MGNRHILGSLAAELHPLSLFKWFFVTFPLALTMEQTALGVQDMDHVLVFVTGVL